MAQSSPNTKFQTYRNVHQVTCIEQPQSLGKPYTRLTLSSQRASKSMQRPATRKQLRRHRPAMHERRALWLARLLAYHTCAKNGLTICRNPDPPTLSLLSTQAKITTKITMGFPLCGTFKSLEISKERTNAQRKNKSSNVKISRKRIAR